MRKFAIILTFVLAPFAANTEDATSFTFEDLLREFEQMTDSVMPLMQDWMDILVPQLEALGETIGDLSQYEAPEVLPNGDIIIRKKLGPPEPGQTDL